MNLRAENTDEPPRLRTNVVSTTLILLKIEEDGSLSYKTKYWLLMFISDVILYEYLKYNSSASDRLFMMSKCLLF